MGEWGSDGKPIRRVMAVDGGPIDIGAENLEAGSVGATQLASGSVTKAKTKMFISTEQTGTGAAQNIAHGLGAVPVNVFVTPTDLTAATVGQFGCRGDAHHDERSRDRNNRQEIQSYGVGIA